MSAEFLDRYSRARQSPLHRLGARLKLLTALAIILLLAFLPAGRAVGAPVPIGWFQLAAAAAIFAALVVARIPLRYVAVRLLFVAPLVFALAFSIPLSRGLGSGWEAMIAVAVKGILCFSTVLLLVNTTPFEELLAAMTRLGVPKLLVATLGFMVRYVFVLLDELARMRRARRARTFARRPFADWRQAASLVGMLVVRSYERAERVYWAMLARGFDGTVRSLHERQIATPPVAESDD